MQIYLNFKRWAVIQLWVLKKSEPCSLDPSPPTMDREVACNQSLDRRSIQTWTLSTWCKTLPLSLRVTMKLWWLIFYRCFLEPLLASTLRKSASRLIASFCPAKSITTCKPDLNWLFWGGWRQSLPALLKTPRRIKVAQDHRGQAGDKTEKLLRK